MMQTFRVLLWVVATSSCAFIGTSQTVNSPSSRKPSVSVPIPADKLEIEQALAQKERQACDGKADVATCRSSFLNALSYRTVALDPNGAIGKIVKLPALQFCGSRGCSFVVLRLTGNDYQKVFDGVVESIELGSSTTNGFFNLEGIDRNSDTGNDEHIKYVWSGSGYVSEATLAEEEQKAVTTAGTTHEGNAQELASSGISDCDASDEQLRYCKRWTADRKGIRPYCTTANSPPALTPNVPPDLGTSNVPSRPSPYCPQVLIQTSDFGGHVTQAELAAAHQELIDDSERIANSYKLNAVRCTPSDPRSQADREADPECIARIAREAAALAERENEKKALLASKVADKASASSHITKYRGIYVGEFIENAPIMQSGCKVGDIYMQEAMESIGMGTSLNECVIVSDDSGRVKQILVFTTTPYLQEYRELVARYGASLPGRFAELSTEASNCCNAWRTKDNTIIWEHPERLTVRGTAATAYRNREVSFTLVEFESPDR